MVLTTTMIKTTMRRRLMLTRRTRTTQRHRVATMRRRTTTMVTADYPAVHDNGSDAGSGADDVEVVGVTGSDLNEMMAHSCFTIGFRRQVRMSVQFTDEHGSVSANICCEPCLDGNGHSPECEANTRRAWRLRQQDRRQEQRQRRRAATTTTTPGPTRGGAVAGASAASVWLSM